MLNEGRELLEKMIDTAHKSGATAGHKPRTCRERARRDWLRFARDRKPSRKKIRKAIRQQLGYVRRDLGYLEDILGKQPEALSAKELEYLAVIQAMYEQQRQAPCYNNGQFPKQSTAGNVPLSGLIGSLCRHAGSA